MRLFLLCILLGALVELGGFEALGECERVSSRLAYANVAGAEDARRGAPIARGPGRPGVPLVIEAEGPPDDEPAVDVEDSRSAEPREYPECGGCTFASYPPMCCDGTPVRAADGPPSLYAERRAGPAPLGRCESCDGAASVEAGEASDDASLEYVSVRGFSTLEDGTIEDFDGVRAVRTHERVFWEELEPDDAVRLSFVDGLRGAAELSAKLYRVQHAQELAPRDSRRPGFAREIRMVSFGSPGFALGVYVSRDGRARRVDWSDERRTSDGSIVAREGGLFERLEVVRA